MGEIIELCEMMPAMLETLESSGRVTLTVTGNSMLPMLHHRKDTVTLVKPTLPLKKYSLPLYYRPDGHYVMHRVIKVKNGVYKMRGDNCDFAEYGMTDANIIAVVESFVRNGKEYSTSSKAYKIYSVLWSNPFGFFLRKKAYRAFIRAGSFVKRKILRIKK